MSPSPTTPPAKSPELNQAKLLAVLRNDIDDQFKALRLDLQRIINSAESRSNRVESHQNKEIETKSEEEEEEEEAEDSRYGSGDRRKERTDQCDEFELKKKRVLERVEKEREFEARIKKLLESKKETSNLKNDDRFVGKEDNADDLKNNVMMMMDGKMLLMKVLMNWDVYNREEICGVVVKILEMSSDPGEMVLDAMQGFYVRDSGSEGGFGWSDVRKSCILLLEMLMSLNRCFKASVRVRAMCLARQWKLWVELLGTKYYHLMVVGFLQLVATYGLSYGFDRDELSKLVDIVALHWPASRFYESLGLTDKVLGCPSSATTDPTGGDRPKLKDGMLVETVQPSLFKSKSAAPPPCDTIVFRVEEELHVILKRDGVLSKFDVEGVLSVLIPDEKYAYIQIQVESGSNPSILFKPHPKINREFFASRKILELKDINKPFPCDQSGGGINLMKWSMQSADASALPLTINCWPCVTGNKTHVIIEYEASSMYDLQNVVVSVPLPALQQAPNVKQIDGNWRYDSRNAILEWLVARIDNSNRRGSMVFVVPLVTDTSNLFPISVLFSASNSCTAVKVVNVLPLKSGSPPRYVQRNLLHTGNYEVV